MTEAVLNYLIGNLVNVKYNVVKHLRLNLGKNMF